MKAPKMVLAAYAGLCPSCGHRYHPGTPITPTASKRWAHQECVTSLVPQAHTLRLASWLTLALAGVN